MRLPEEIDQISLDRQYDPMTPYPPLGFVPFFENQVGNGDMFGLYWPLGKEDDFPLVFETYHDEWRVAPPFSSLAAFLRKAKGEDGYVETPTIEEDSTSPLANYSTARECLRRRDVDGAIKHLETAISIFPEYTDALCLLCGQYHRTGRTTEAANAAILAIISSPSFGGQPEQALRVLKSLRNPPADIGDDPVWRCRDKLALSFGGTKENQDYDLLREAITDYRSSGQSYRAALLLQTFCERMYTETVSFQERYGFRLDKAMTDLKALCEQELGRKRVLP